MEDPIPSAETATVAAEMNNALGYAASEADRIFGAEHGQTALFWALVETVRQHTMPTREPKSEL